MYKRKILKKRYKYKRKFINTCIMRIRYGHRSERTIRGYKMYIFKAMKEVVDKNIVNYLHLLFNSPCRDIPEYDEVLADCYIMLDKCIEKFKVKKGANFYFYYNKSMSRNFYRLYQRECCRVSTDLTDEIANVHPMLLESKRIDGVEVIFKNFGFTRLEKDICLSRMKGERCSEFLRRRKKVTLKKYNDALRRVKEMLLMAQVEDKY